VGDPVVVTLVRSDELLRLGVDPVEGDVEVPVVGVAVKGVDGLVVRHAHLVEEHPDRLVCLRGRGLLALPPAQDPVLDRPGVAAGDLGEIGHLLDLAVVVPGKEVERSAVLDLLAGVSSAGTGDVVGQVADVRREALGRGQLGWRRLLDDQGAPPSPAARRAMATRKSARAAAVSAL
jgi:hypothetical protein